MEICMKQEISMLVEDLKDEQKNIRTIEGRTGKYAGSRRFRCLLKV
jgi:hypothetical protein